MNDEHALGCALDEPLERHLCFASTGSSRRMFAATARRPGRHSESLVPSTTFVQTFRSLGTRARQELGKPETNCGILFLTTASVAVYHMEIFGMRKVVLLAILALIAGLGSGVGAQPTDDLASQVRDAERAFARSMADRNFAAFSALVADDAVFFGGRGAQRGKAAVLAGWKAFFDQPQAPFSWEPETVEVLSSGTLGLSSGPVKDPNGKQTGIFNSIWRRETDGRWRVVFDKGCQVCDCPAGP